jgi:transcription elongation factor Elf1
MGRRRRRKIRESENLPEKKFNTLGKGMNNVSISGIKTGDPGSII